MTSVRAFRERVEDLNEQRGHLCVGIDPRPDRLPKDYQDPEGLESWCLDLVETTQDHAAAYKPNLAFFLALGPPGIEALEIVVDRAKDTGAMTILDAKFADIGSTASAYARFAADVLDVDVVTINPYMGTDVLDAFLDEGLDAFVLARTTNPSAADIQEAIAGKVVQRFSVRGTGFVAPGNDPDTIRHVRDTAGGSPLLLPGIGAQGGSATEAVHTAAGGPFLIAIARSIAFTEGTFPQSAGEAAERFADEIETALDRPG